MSNTPIYYSDEGVPFKVIGLFLDASILYIIAEGMGGEYDGAHFVVHSPGVTDLFLARVQIVGEDKAMQEAYKTLSGEEKWAPTVDAYSYLGVLRTMN